MWGC
jgi:hypothetical protein